MVCLITNKHCYALQCKGGGGEVASLYRAQFSFDTVILQRENDVTFAFAFCQCKRTLCLAVLSRFTHFYAVRGKAKREAHGA